MVGSHALGQKIGRKKAIKNDWSRKILLRHNSEIYHFSLIPFQ